MRKPAFIGAIFALLLATGAWSGARAQQPISLGQPVIPTGWSFNVAPYLWLPTVNATVNYRLPSDLGGRLPTEASTGPGNYLSHLDFAVALSADARNGPFSLLTDYMFARFSLAESHIRSLDFFGLPSMPISRSLQTHVGTTFSESIWTLAGGYTVLQGEWGSLDLLVGVRLLNLNSTTDYSLAFLVTSPRGNGATFGGNGNISASGNIWNGIAGLRGRIRLADTQFFVPYYFDIGGGGSSPTWQISSGLAYQFSWGAISATYRYLSFQQGGDAFLKHVTYGGPMLMANFSF